MRRRDLNVPSGVSPGVAVRPVGRHIETAYGLPMLHDPRVQLGVRLFNQGAFFAYQEIWEELWHELRGREHDCLPGLIQVADHHLQRRNLRGARYLSTRAALRLARCGPGFASIQVSRFCERLAEGIAAAGLPAPRSVGQAAARQVGQRGSVSRATPRLSQRTT